ncbi:MAG: cobalamin-binding protein [Candidatus Bathyarchaeota archaeon]|nr:cobalamin-binding protein [Candidatus Bathyarchaeum sp.]
MDKNVTYIVAILAVVSLVVAAYGLVTFQGQIDDLNSSVDDIQQTLTTIQDQIDNYQPSSEDQEITLVDSMGNVVTLTSIPERIVSLAPSNTEILFAIGAGENVVGVTDFCDYPYNFTAWIESGNLTSIGNYYGPSVEPIVALNPDLVLASSGSLEAAATLADLGYNVLVVEGHTVDDILQDILLVGRATGNNAEASALVTQMRARLDAVAAQLADATTTPKVYYEVWYEPLQSVGPETFIDEIITLAGGENIFNDATTSWPTASSEEIIEKNPDVLVFPDTYMSQNYYDIDAVDDRPGWTTITAVQNGAIYEIDENLLVRSGPRVVDGVETMAALIHPEIFG